MKLRLPISAVVFLIAAGCVVGPGPRVVSDVTSFYVSDFSGNGSIAVVAADAGINNSLEFAHYKKKFEERLSANGYTISNSPENAKYIALVAYGIDNGQSATVSTPIYGQTSGGTTTTSGTIYSSGGSATFSGTSYTMPTYGVVGSVTGSRTSYKRAIALDIVDAASLKGNEPKTVYEGRIKSTGSCPVIVEVFDEMLEAMFTDWPGESGKNRHVTVSSVADC